MTRTPDRRLPDRFGTAGCHAHACAGMLNPSRVLRLHAVCRLRILLAAVLVAIAPGHASFAAGSNAGQVESLEQQAFQAAAQRVAPSVVRVETVGGLSQAGEVHFGAGPTTGTIISPDGYIISSAFNFLNQPDSILVQLANGSRKPARLIATDHNRLVVLLKIEPDAPLPVAEAAPQADTRVGQWAMAVGRTFEGNQPNMAVGIVSALNRIWGKALQTDAAVSPSNYGGPLIDIHGRVLGIITPMSPESGNELAGYQWYNSGIGFAVSIQDVQAILPRLKQGKDLHSGILGISFARNTSNFAPPVIAAIHPNSPAFKIGLKPGDRVTAVAGQAVQRLAEFRVELAKRYAGDRLTLSVMRNGKQIAVEAELAAELEPYQHPFLGVLPMRTPRQEDPKPSGIAVRYVYPDSPAARAGIQRGDVLASLDGTATPDADALRRAISGKTVGAKASLEVRRGANSSSVSVQLAALPEALPPDPLPEATPVHPPTTKSPQRPQVGLFSKRLPELPNQAWVYVPEDYHPAVAYGLCVWLHAPGGFDEKKLLLRWKSHCDRDQLILLAPKSVDPDRWQLQELVLIDKLMSEVARSYTIDPTRIVVAGRQAGGTLAYLAAFQNPERIRGVAAIDARLAGRPPEGDPLRRLAFFLAQTPEAANADSGSDAARLRKDKYPVTLREIGADPEADGLPDLARWIDTLDRI